MPKIQSIHFDYNGRGYPLCNLASTVKTVINCSTDAAEVTCKVCLKYLAKREAA
jgi:hypothetical protein